MIHSWWPEEVRAAFRDKEAADAALISAVLAAMGQRPTERLRAAALGGRGKVWPQVLASVVVGAEKDGVVRRPLDAVASDVGTTPHGVTTTLGRQAARVGDYNKLPVRWEGSDDQGWALAMDVEDARLIRDLLIEADQWPYDVGESLFPEAIEAADAADRDADLEDD